MEDFVVGSSISPLDLYGKFQGWPQRSSVRIPQSLTGAGKRTSLIGSAGRFRAADAGRIQAQQDKYCGPQLELSLVFMRISHNNARYRVNSWNVKHFLHVYESYPFNECAKHYPLQLPIALPHDNWIPRYSCL